MIVQYELVAPVTDRKAPYLDRFGAFIVPAIKKLYKYYIEVKRYNPNTLCYEYFLLLGTETAARGNVQFEYIESDGLYDVWQIV